MKIEAGKYYVTRGGDVVGPMVRWSEDDKYPWSVKVNSGKRTYTHNGSWFEHNPLHEYDLIKEYVMPKFKVGDRVRDAGGWGGVVIEVCELVNEMVKIERDGGGVELTHANNVSLVSSASPLDLTKPVQTRDGRKVRLLCTDGPGEWPVIGIIDGRDDVCRWPLNGRVVPYGDLSVDLVNTPATPRTFERWFNVYASEDTPTVILTLPRMNREDADAMSILSEQHSTDSNFRRIARKRIVFTEGEWDE